METRIVVVDSRTVVSGHPEGGIYTTKKDVAEKLGISVRSLHRWLNETNSFVIEYYHVMVLPLIKKQ